MKYFDERRLERTQATLMQIHAKQLPKVRAPFADINAFRHMPRPSSYALCHVTNVLKLAYINYSCMFIFQLLNERKWSSSFYMFCFKLCTSR